MKKIISTLAITTVAMLCALPALAQPKRANSTGGNSPHETTSTVIGGRGGPRVTVTYGRPYAKGRKIWGQLVPWDKPWRLGSDEATTLITQQPLVTVIDGKTIPAGAYTLYLVPSENGTTQLAFSTALGGWGIPVDTTHDLVRVEMKEGNLTTAPVEQLTVTIVNNTNAGIGELTITWETKQFTMPFTIKK